MKRIYFIIILFVYPLFSQQSDWATTRFEKYWKKSFNKMIFREPINFSPYSIKVGYYNYGGKNFFSKLGLNPFDSDEMGGNPFSSLDDTSIPVFDKLKDVSYRRMAALELDFLTLSTACSMPLLLKPILFIKEFSFLNLKSLGFKLPG